MLHLCFVWLVVSELYTVTVLMEAAMMGADIDGEVLVYLEMAQVNFELQPPESIKASPTDTESEEAVVTQTFVL